MEVKLRLLWCFFVRRGLVECGKSSRGEAVPGTADGCDECGAWNVQLPRSQETRCRAYCLEVSGIQQNVPSPEKIGRAHV